jgi:hypothetical protein
MNKLAFRHYKQSIGMVLTVKSDIMCIFASSLTHSKQLKFYHKTDKGIETLNKNRK